MKLKQLSGKRSNKLKKILITIKMSEASFKQLADQKNELIKKLYRGKLTKKINGIINLIDSIQDQVVENGDFPDYIVFPYVYEEVKDTCEKCKKKKKFFMHNCLNSHNFTEIFGCPKCDDKCIFCT